MRFCRRRIPGRPPAGRGWRRRARAATRTGPDRETEDPDSPCLPALPEERARLAVAAGKPAATCNNCHASHQILRANDPKSTVYRENIPKTCGSCHGQETKVYLESIHGTAMRQGFTKSPVCTDCHGEHSISGVQDPNSRVSLAQVTKTCSSCHQALEITEKYGLSGNRVATYQDSFHGPGGARREPHGGQLLELSRLPRRPAVLGSQVLDLQEQPGGHLREVPSGGDRELCQGRGPRGRHAEGRADPVLHSDVLSGHDRGNDRRHGGPQRAGLPEEAAATLRSWEGGAFLRSAHDGEARRSFLRMSVSERNPARAPGAEFHHVGLHGLCPEVPRKLALRLVAALERAPPGGR